jgi:hypothetical protein
MALYAPLNKGATGPQRAAAEHAGTAVVNEAHSLVVDMQPAFRQHLSVYFDTLDEQVAIACLARSRPKVVGIAKFDLLRIWRAAEVEAKRLGLSGRCLQLRHNGFGCGRRTFHPPDFNLSNRLSVYKDIEPRRPLETDAGGVNLKAGNAATRGILFSVGNHIRHAPLLRLYPSGDGLQQGSVVARAVLDKVGFFRGICLEIIFLDLAGGRVEDDFSIIFAVAELVPAPRAEEERPVRPLLAEQAVTLP